MSAGNTNIKIFNEAQSATNTYSDAQYLDATQRLSGLSGGMALTEQHNKMFLQWSVMAYALAQYISGQGYDCLDSAPSAIPTNLASAINNQISNSSITNVINSMSWPKSTTVTVGKLIFSANLPVGCVAVVTTAGTTGTAEPTWTAAGTTVNDNTVVWTVESLTASLGSFVGATSGTNGKSGGVPAPASGQQNNLLAGDGTWKTLSALFTAASLSSVNSSQAIFTLGALTVQIINVTTATSVVTLPQAFSTACIAAIAIDNRYATDSYDRPYVGKATGWSKTTINVTSLLNSVNDANLWNTQDFAGIVIAVGY